MSVCHIKIQFDRENRTYHPREVVSGQVVVQPNEDITCRRLEIRLSGPGQSKVLDSSIYRKTVWKKGNVYTYPFVFNAPLEPMTYNGRHFSIDWYVGANADIPTSWLLSAAPSSQEPFHLTSESPLYFRIPSFDSQGLSLHWVLNEIPTEWGLIFGILAVTGGSTFAFMAATRSEPSIFQLLLAIATAIVGFYVLSRNLPIWLSKRQLGQREVGFSALPENKGLIGLIWFTPKTTGQIQRIEMNLLIREIATEDYVTGAFDSISTKVHEHTVFEKNETDTQLYDFNSKETFEAKIAIKSDSPLPASYNSDNSRIEWLVTVKIVFSNWATWRRKVFVEAIQTR